MLVDGNALIFYSVWLLYQNQSHKCATQTYTQRLTIESFNSITFMHIKFVLISCIISFSLCLFVHSPQTDYVFYHVIIEFCIMQKEKNAATKKLVSFGVRNALDNVPNRNASYSSHLKAICGLFSSLSIHIETGQI